ncbi:MAG: helix-turn-helix transcriptional regulator [Clostridia bacterium]|nr:helix-turn-helix transcriptional regulator [Clostridia bacterium]
MHNELPTIITCGLFDSKNKHRNKTVSAPRNVKHYEFEFYDTDNGISVVNGNEYLKKYGSILIGKPGDVRYSYLPLVCKFIRFRTDDPILIEELNNVSTFFFPQDAKRINAYVEEIFQYFYSENKFDRLMANAKLLTLLHLLVNEPRKNENIISKCRQYVESHYYEDITTADMANTCSVSVSYLYKLFKAELGLTPGDFLLNCRISAAKNMLINSNLPLNEIAVNCGFNSQSYFSECFKRKCGISPHSFRKTTSTSYLL